MSLGWLEGDLNRVLRAIDKLRNRKSRPNLPGLSRYLMRAHDFSSDKTLHLLDILIAREKVKEVVYKGNISYRNMLNWREPTKPNIKELHSTVNSAIVISTMKTLLENQDLNSVKPGVEEAALQAALIEQLDGAVKLDEIRKQIQTQVERKTLVKNKFNRYLLGSKFRDTDDESDMELSENDEKADAIKNLELSIDNVVQNIQLLSDDDVTEHVGVKKRRKIWQVGSRTDHASNISDKTAGIADHVDSRPDLARTSPPAHSSPAIQHVYQEKPQLPKPLPKIRKRKHSRDKDRAFHGPRNQRSSIPDPSPDQPTETKNRRIIKKKTIYDPSEFELTPVVRKLKKKTENAPPLPLGRGGLGRGMRRGSSRWRADEDSDESSNSSISSTPPKTNSSLSSVSTADTAGKQVGKNCCICNRQACKTQPNMLSCSLCLNIAHEDCSDMRDIVYIGSKKWRCQDCNMYNPVICSLCHTDSDQHHQKSIMLMCDYCEDFYHNTCHYPSVQPADVQRGAVWRCAQCPPNSPERVTVKVEEEEDEDEELEGEEKEDIIDLADFIGVPRLDQSYRPLPSQARSFTDRATSPLLQEVKTEDGKKCGCSCLTLQVIRNSDRSLSGRHKPHEEIPTVDHWTVQQVHQYFYNAFDQQVADAFSSQEIDGKRLLELSRGDITDKLGLEFGIALKVLYYVKKIQLGTNLLHELWPRDSPVAPLSDSSQTL